MVALLDNIKSVAKYESKLLMRSWFYRIFLVLAVLVLCIFNFAFLVNPDISQYWIMRALPSNIPYINLLLLNTGQAVIAVFLSSEFLKSDKKLDTSEVFYVHPLSNAEYVIGKIWGNMNVFLRLNLIIIFIVAIFNFVSGVTIDWVSYVTYFLLISVPTLIYIFGLSIGCMLIIKNQAITFVLLLGYIALTLFYISDKFYYLFDYMVYNTPLVKSSIVGFTNWSALVNHRLMYLFIGLGFICISIFLFRRLPNDKYGRYRWLALSFCLILSGLFAGFKHVNSFLSASNMRAKYVEINNKYVNMPQMVIDDYDINMEQFPETISASVTMRGTVQTASSVFTFCLNPSLTVREIKEYGKDLSFTRDHQIILIDFGRILQEGDTTTCVITYDGRINENFCYLDIPDDLLQEKYASDFFHIDKKYSFQTEKYVLFTPETYWYPRPGVAYSSENPDWQQAYFSNYRTTVKTINGLQALTQGTRLTPREKIPTIRSNEYDSNDGFIRPVGGRGGGGGMFFMGGGPMGGIGNLFRGGGPGGPGGPGQQNNRQQGPGGQGQQNNRQQGPQGQSGPGQQNFRQQGPQGGQGGDFRGQGGQGGDNQQFQNRPQRGGGDQQGQDRFQGGRGDLQGQGGPGGDFRGQGGQGGRRQGDQGPGGGGFRAQSPPDSAMMARMREDPEFRERMRDSIMRMRENDSEFRGPDGSGFRTRVREEIAENTDDAPVDSIFIFRTDFPTPAISLIIGDYEQKCVEVDRAVFSLWHLKGSDFFTGYFDAILDTIPYQIRLRRQTFENNYSLNYSFRRFSVIEVPVQFYSYVRTWTKAQEVIQPEMVLFPEKGCLFNNLDVIKQIPLQKSFAKRMGREISDNDAAINVFNTFLMTFQRSEGAREFSMERGTANITVKPNPFFLFPQLYNFRYNIFSSEWTIANRLIELYLQDMTDNNRMRQLNGISDNEKANLLIQKRPFKELLTDPNQRNLLDNIISMKANVLFAPAELNIGNLEFRDSLRAYLNNNRFGNLRFEDLLDEMSQIAGVDLIAAIETWDAPANLPVYIVGQPEITYIINRDVEVYVTKLQITNDSDYEGIVNVDINFGGGGGGFGGGGGGALGSGGTAQRSDDYDPRTKRKISLAARETKLLVNVWEEAPRSINVNTLISANLPNLINMPASSIIREQNVPIPEEGDFILANASYNVLGEVIVDNEDALLFELSQPDIVGLLPQWLEDVGDNSFPYSGVTPFRPPLQWTLTTNAGYYGSYIRSAYVIKSGSGSQTATWKVPVPSKGLYDLYYYVYKPDELRRNNNSRGNIEYQFKVIYGGDEDKAQINLRRANDGWTRIGTGPFPFFDDDTIKIVLTNDIKNVRMVTADAVKIVRRATSSESNPAGDEFARAE